MGGFSGGRRRTFRSRHRAPMGEGGRLAVIFVSLALVLFVIAVMIGNYLRTVAEGVVAETSGDDTTEAEIYYANAPDAVVARGIVFGAAHLSSPEETDGVAVTSELPETEADTSAAAESIKYDSVSVTLRQKDSDGVLALAYSSPVSLEYRIDRVGDTDLSDGIEQIFEVFGARTMICGIFEVDHPNRAQQTREVMRAYELALLCELVRAGVDEIILVGFGGDTDAGVSFISDVYEQVGRSTAVGLALPFDYVNSSDAKERLIALSKKCALLAIDLYSVEVPTLMTPEELIADRVARAADVRREFSLRILLGCGTAPDGDSQTRTAMEHGAKNTMVGLGLPMSAEEAETEPEITE